MTTALVLSGGGAIGAYEMGVWRALRKLHIDINIVTGTSVGALNGMLITQDTYLKGLLFWQNVHYNNIFDTKVNEKDDKAIKKMIIKETLNDGIKVNNLEKMIKKVLEPKKFYNSEINFGLITYNLSKLKPISLTKKEIKEKDLVNYLMASATCFPLFTKKKIDKDYYIDGGYYDNLPINLALDMGADKIIAVDLKEIGIKQKVKSKNVSITYITPSIKLGNIISFNQKVIRKLMRIGYNDTLKIFKIVQGKIYSFKNDNYQESINNYHELFKSKLNDYKLKRKIVIPEIIDFLGKTYDLNPLFIYNLSFFNKLLIKNVKSIKVSHKMTLKTLTLKNKATSLNSKSIVKYFYNRIINCKTLKEKNEIKALELIFKKEFLSAIYLVIINE